MPQQSIDIPGVDWQDSFVLRWLHERDRLVFDLLASLWPGHPSYAPPPPSDWTCYRAAQLIFHEARQVTGLKEMQDVHSGTDAEGSVDYGNIDALLRDDDGAFLIYGDFGAVRVVAAGMQLVVGEAT